MNEEIKVYVISLKGRTNLSMRYQCPLTGKRFERSTGTNMKSEAVKVAAKWEAELQEGRYKKGSRMTWDEFCDRFLEDGTGGKKQNTIRGYFDTLVAFNRHCKPRGVCDLTTPRMATFSTELRKPYKRRKEIVRRAEASVARHLRHMKAICRWAHRQGIIHTVPSFEMPKGGGQRMKGRPITLEEFERMLTVTEKVVGKQAADSWKLLLRGLWASGLRLSEALSLRWDYQPGCVGVVLNGNKSVLTFDAESQKSGKVQLVPLAPEAVEILEPLQKDAGYVFNTRCRDGSLMARDMLKHSKVISTIGQKANVIVDPATRKPASAHDLRRAFGFRWSRLIKTPQLQELMRHASIETTLTYYVGQNAESTAQELWEALGDKLGDKSKDKGLGDTETPRNKHPEQDSNLRPTD